MDGRLLSFIERLENLQAQKDEISEDMKEVRKEAKDSGYDVPTINRLLKLRKLSEQERREQEQLVETYEAALGPLGDTPLGTAAKERAGVNVSEATRRAAKKFIDTAAKHPGDSVSIGTLSGTTTIKNVDGRKVVERTALPPDLRAEYDAARDAAVAPEPIAPPKDVAGSLASIKAAMHAPAR